MKYIECPAEYTSNGEKALFMAGGISNCPDWQQALKDLLNISNITLINPRRKNFDTSNLNMEKEQIEWEFNHLNKSSAISFWFPKETLCPITLYELGKQSMTNNPIFIGIHPEYPRKRDVEIQTKFIRPEIKVVYSLQELAEQIKKWSDGIS